MKKCVFALALVWTGFALAQEPVNEFLGVWKVGEGTAKPFYITIKEDGTASKTIGTNTMGTWKLEEGQLRTDWQDGWINVFKKEGDGYVKTGYRPGASFPDRPTNKGSVEKVESAPEEKPASYDPKGTWHVTDSDGEAFRIVINENGLAEAQWTKPYGVKTERGTWRMSGDSLIVDWNNGWTDVIKKEGEAYTKSAYSPKAGVGDEPNNVGPARKE